MRITPKLGFTDIAVIARWRVLRFMATLNPPKGKLHHRTPGWVTPGSTFHIRIRTDPRSPSLTMPELGRKLLKSVRHYHRHGRWCCSLFLLMPDHLHALLSFPPYLAMSRVLGEWKKFHDRQSGAKWQDGYFDHRIRDRREFEESAAYIRNNPVVKGLCVSPADWPWVVDENDLNES